MASASAYMPLNVGGAHNAQVSSCPRPTVEVTGAGRMAGMSSANPETVERGQELTGALWAPPTFSGRYALADAIY